MNELFPLIKKINGLLFRQFNESCQKYGLTGKQFMLLNYLYQNQSNENDIFSQKEVEQEFQVRRSTVSSILHTLEKKGFIYRSVDASDQRKKVLILTDKAKEIIKVAKAEKLHNDNILFSVLKEDEYKTLLTLLNTVYDHLLSK
ncbi:MAG TPA: MarR family transcriptional regulator [Clostridia bacterium]